MKPSEIRTGRVYAGRDPRINLPWPHCCQHRTVRKIVRGVVTFRLPDGHATTKQERRWGCNGVHLATFAAWAVADVTDQYGGEE